MYVVCRSSLTKSERPAGTSYVAFGVADGSVGLLKLQQKLSSLDNAEFSFTPDYQVDLDITNDEEQVQSADKAGLTGLEWISTSSGGVRLFLRGLVLDLMPPSSQSWSSASQGSYTSGLLQKTRGYLGLGSDAWNSKGKRSPAPRRHFTPLLGYRTEKLETS